MDLHASPVRLLLASLIGGVLFNAAAAAGDGGASGGSAGGLTQAEADLLYAPLGGGGACAGYPVGSVYLGVLPTNPGTLLGCGTWTQIAQGRALVGQDSGDTQFDVAEETSGAKTVASAGSVSQPTFTGTPFSDVINHTHTVDVTDPGHTHVQGVNSASTGGTSGYTADTSTNTRVNSGYSTSSGTTGITAATQNPAGGAASITPAGTVSTPTFTGSATSVVQPSFVIYVWKRTL